MASPAQIAANQVNSRKSTGPSTPQGRAKSSMNALKHGTRSRKLALLREESCAFEERLRKWMGIGDVQNDVEEYLVYRNVCLSFELDRTQRARLERRASLIEKRNLKTPPFFVAKDGPGDFDQDKEFSTPPRRRVSQTR